MLEAAAIYLALGCIAGLAAGLLGVGGGLIIVPGLVLALKHQGFDDSMLMHLALGTSLASIAFTALASAWAHQRRGALDWRLVRGLSLGMLLGSLTGALAADRISSASLQVLFAAFELCMAVYLIVGAPAVRRALVRAISRLELFLVGGGIGALSAILGIGGGTLTVPYLCWRGRGIHQAVAVSAACGLPIALAGALGYGWAGRDAPGLPALATGYVYWPAWLGIIVTSLLFAPLGARLAHALPVARLQRVFGMVLLFIAVSMLFI